MKSHLSSIEVHKPAIKKIGQPWQRRLYEYTGYTVADSVGRLLKIQGFDDYNRLIDINGLFSSMPTYDPVDRTGSIQNPMVFAIPRPWKKPTRTLSLETALEMRVQELCSRGQPINIFWSGGVDSTTIVTAFLVFAPEHQTRILYSPWSVYEHPEFFQLLQSRGADLIDLSGEAYFSIDLDGIYVTGNCGDELHASVDETFFYKHGFDRLHSPWQDFFKQHMADDGFMDFCQDFFSRSGRPIDTVLEARWWFYTNTKIHGMFNACEFTLLSIESQQFDPSRLVGFFDCEAYESFVFFNLDRLLPSDDYASWRQFLKDFCFAYDGFDHWRQHKSKLNSRHIGIFNEKKIILNDVRHLLMLEDGSRVATPNLPLFSRQEWEEIAPNYTYLFNPP